MFSHLGSPEPASPWTRLWGLRSSRDPKALLRLQVPDDSRCWPSLSPQPWPSPTGLCGSAAKLPAHSWSPGTHEREAPCLPRVGTPKFLPLPWDHREFGSCSPCSSPPDCGTLGQGKFSSSQESDSRKMPSQPEGHLCVLCEGNSFQPLGSTWGYSQGLLHAVASVWDKQMP